MPGEPAETFIGVGALGFGVLLVVAAYRNVSPVGLIRNALTSGSLDFGKAGPLVGPTATWHSPPAVDKALADIAVKDPGLSASIAAELAKIDSNSARSATTHLFDLLGKARADGFGAQADTIEQYVNNLVPAVASNPSPGAVFI